MKIVNLIIMVVMMTTAVYASNDVPICNEVKCDYIDYCVNNNDETKWAPSRTKCLIDGEPSHPEPKDEPKVTASSSSGMSTSKVLNILSKDESVQKEIRSVSLIEYLKGLFVKQGSYNKQMSELNDRVLLLEAQTSFCLEANNITKSQYIPRYWWMQRGVSQ